jgi:hypothetical protein
MVAHDLRNQIREAFPATQFYGPITSCKCDECMSIREGLQRKQWDQVPTAFLDSTCSPTLLTPEAFQAFLPAYLLRSLDDLSLHSVVLEFTVYSLCPDDHQENGHEAQSDRPHGYRRLVQRASLMSPAQTQAIRSFLLFVQENAADREWFRPFITRALQTFWR